MENEDLLRRMGARVMDNAWWSWKVFCDTLLLQKMVTMTPQWAMYLGDEEDVFGDWTEWEWWECTSDEWFEDDDIDPGEMDPNWGEGGHYIDEY